MANAEGRGSAMMVMMVTGAGTPGLLFFLGSWTLMMVAMMFPSAAPMVRSFVALSRKGHAGSSARGIGESGVFLGAYVLVWTLFGVGIVALYFLASPHVGALASRGNMGVTIAGVVLLAAGVYQFTPLKRVCLKGCQSPLEFLLRRWRSGLKGAFSVGLRHASFCVGCCWLLFIVLFAVGVMSLPWMAFLGVAIFAEKTFPRGDQVAHALGALFMVTGAVFLALPSVGAGFLV
ncbi:MAG: DUF2182 domain-containing protein [Euryarchaeota archaeon]|nr:DUF2182 domain-containing protein [Euryarchaeota archaeon]MDE1837741.1 DUF2182 domain-containing protein [Euryarchaeota archaeon]MDE2046096.1 DUF2182 domain-containing protein [Thermoplasmata archaeon]